MEGGGEEAPSPTANMHPTRCAKVNAGFVRGGGGVKRRKGLSFRASYPTDPRCCQKQLLTPCMDLLPEGEGHKCKLYFVTFLCGRTLVVLEGCSCQITK